MGRGGMRASALNIGRGSQSIGLIDPLGIWGSETGYPLWWNPNGVDLPVVAAWRAVNTAGCPYGPGPASYAASLVELTGNSIDLVEGNGAIPWGLPVGWQFNGVALQYLITGITVANDQSYSAFVRFGNFVTGYLLGSEDGAGNRFGLRQAAGNRRYYNGGADTPGVCPPAGNLAVLGDQGYLNGAPDGLPIAPWAGAAVSPLWIGGANQGGVLSLPCTADIAAVALYGPPVAAVQAEAAAIFAAMGTL